MDDSISRWIQTTACVEPLPGTKHSTKSEARCVIISVDGRRGAAPSTGEETWSTVQLISSAAESDSAESPFSAYDKHRQEPLSQFLVRPEQRRPFSWSSVVRDRPARNDSFAKVVRHVAVVNNMDVADLGYAGAPTVIRAIGDAVWSLCVQPSIDPNHPFFPEDRAPRPIVAEYNRIVWRFLLDHEWGDASSTDAAPHGRMQSLGALRVTSLYAMFRISRNAR
jgi:hypothetical protein